MLIKLSLTRQAYYMTSLCFINIVPYHPIFVTFGSLLKTHSHMS